ncbi:hypothetical protein WAX86_10795 [Photobacterium damselae subsp. damselae]|uniref:hypothetical protein n=1 Tax=Photobacterium damselae TaxID=38293 RepID=UPI00311AD227
MSHIYFNVECPYFSEVELLKSKSRIKFSFLDNSVEMFVDHKLWENKTPLYEKDNKLLFVAGWFINSDYELNNIEKLFADLENNNIKDIVDSLVAGVFIAGYYDHKQAVIFSDPFGLTPHYYSLNQGVMRISPSTRDFSSNMINYDYSNILEQQGHMFYNHTKYDDVFKIIPGDLFEINNGIITYNNIGFKINDDGKSVCDIVELTNKLISCFPNNSLSTALSAGFDSRLIFMESNTKYTYTWGQETSLDVINGKKLAHKKNVNHLSFGFKDNIISESTEKMCSYLFDGSVKNYNSQFYENYKYVNFNSADQYIALDGYLGDVLQRGVYMTHSGKKGELLKLFPTFTTGNLTAEKLLEARYCKVDEKLRTLVVNDFHKVIENIYELDELQKVTYFEFLYGRGLRYITTASLCMNSIFKTIVPVFASRYIFSILVQQNAKDTLTYKTFQKIWMSTPKFERELKSEGFYSPSTYPLFIPYINFFGRLITNFHPKYLNYTKK